MFHFDDGYNLAKGTSVEVHAGPDAKDIKKIPVADHDKVISLLFIPFAQNASRLMLVVCPCGFVGKFDSRRCNRLFWTAASVFLGSGKIDIIKVLSTSLLQRGLISAALINWN